MSLAPLDLMRAKTRRIMRQHRLLRVVVEKVRVTGWGVEIHLKIPLPDNPGEDPRRPAPSRTTNRQAICGCVPLLITNGQDSYLLAHATAGNGVKRLTWRSTAPGGEI